MQNLWLKALYLGKFRLNAQLKFWTTVISCRIFAVMPVGELQFSVPFRRRDAALMIKMQLNITCTMHISLL